MKNRYSHLSSEERNMIQRGVNRFMACRASARSDAPQWARYDAAGATQGARARRCRGPRKLTESTPLRAAVIEQLHDGCSPQQIAGRVRSMNPDHPAEQVCHETIYAAIYATPRGNCASR